MGRVRGLLWAVLALGTPAAAVSGALADTTLMVIVVLSATALWT